VRAELAGAPVGPWREAGLTCFRPSPRLTGSQWADAHRIITGGPEPGRWRTNRVPYLREILDAFSDPDVEHIRLMASAQIGKSSVMENAVGFFAHQDPSPILFVQGTESAARSFSKERLSPMFAATPALRGLISQKEKDADATVLLKLFPGGLIAIAWASSSTQLASRAVRVVLADELDRWPTETGEDGDPFLQALARTSTFGSRRKVIAASTPTIDSTSRIARLFEDSDRRHYHCPCPHCGVLQPLEWANLIYKNAQGAVDLDGVHYRCAECDGRIEEHHRPAMLVIGEWVAHNPGHHHRGYQISALYSPWTTWRELAAEWVRAVNDRDRKGMQEFYNLRLGLPWTEEIERITVEELEKNREEYDAEVPDGVLLITVGVDVQDARLEAVVIGWGQHRESWAIRYEIIPGDTSDLSPAGPWFRLDAFLSRAWMKADGQGMLPVCTFVDSGGHRTQEVYTWARERQARNVYACHGVAGQGKPIAGKPSPNQLRALHFPVGVESAKEAIMSRLALQTHGPGFVHYPIGNGFDAEYFKGLLSERLVFRKGRRVWERVYRRNEPLDTLVYATAAMESMVSPNPSLLTPAGAPGSVANSTPRRRILSRGVTF
jgi:phage terminase large subunit GpA-like protein